jgi:hypothetical protein
MLFQNRLNGGWCRLQMPGPGLSLTLRFPAETIPYAAVVLGEGWIHDRDSFVLLEPCSARFDRVDLSRNYTRESKVGPGGTNHWFLCFSVDEAGNA